MGDPSHWGDATAPLPGRSELLRPKPAASQDTTPLSHTSCILSGNGTTPPFQFVQRSTLTLLLISRMQISWEPPAWAG